MGKPAARLGDLTSHGGTIISGSATVFFNGMAAAHGLSMHRCPMVTPATPPLPHVGMGAVPMGALTVLVNGVPAMVLGDMFLCAGPPATVVLGSPTIFIGMAGGGGGAAMASTEPSAPCAPAAGAAVASGQSALRPYDAIPHHQLPSHPAPPPRDALTIRDFIEIFQAVEREEGFEAARHYASVGINYERLTDLARAFVQGRDTNPDNDPNAMPTRFMLLYGAQDALLRCVDPHPDNFPHGPQHTVSIANLRKGLRLLGAPIAQSGGYDDQLLQAHRQYLSRFVMCQSSRPQAHTVEAGESLGAIAALYGLPGWKYLYQINADIIGDNPDLLVRGTQLELPQWDTTRGDEMITQKGADPSYYAQGSSYRYPWVPFSATFVNDDGEAIGSQEELQEELCYELRDATAGTLLASGTMRSGEELELLLPDAQGLQITLDGAVYEIAMKG